MKISFSSIAFTASLFLHTACVADSTNVAFKPLAPESQHPVAFSTALQLIATYHYQKPQINDAFSSEALDNYIGNVDPMRVYFLSSDIQEFEKYRYTIDESILTNGDLSPAYDIFNRYQQRLSDRIAYAFNFINDSNNFNFSLNDSFMTDRENAAYANNMDELNTLWNKKLTYEALMLKSGGKDYTSYSETLRKRYENLRKFASKTKSEEVFQLYCNSLTELADPHTNYFSPRSSEDFNTSMKLSLEGIGATLQIENEYTKIHQVVKGGPAERSKKLVAGDKIIGVAQGDSDIVNVIDWRLDDVVSLIRGKKGTIVRLQIIPAAEPNTTRIVSIKRDVIVLEDQAAKSSIKEIKRNGKTYKYGVIHLPTFYIDFEAASRRDPNYKSTTRDVKKLITELKKQKIDGLIIDLRNNGGGSLQEAVQLTGLFIKRGPVVQVKDMMDNTRNEDDTDDDIFYEGPIAVLVNRFSASASEIFAAAIQDYGRGVVLGEKTFGKGTVQQMQDLAQFIRGDNKKVGQVKLTIAKFYRVNGSSTQHKGVIPDIEFPSVYADAKFGEDANKHALPWDMISATNYEAVNQVNDMIPMLKQRHDERMKNSAEYKYLLEDIANFKEASEDKYATLNEAQQKKENEAKETRRKQREEARKEKKVTNPDLILDETLEVMVDMIKK
jgi:carboxyl-terminal processing protease